ncbi:hypothetical protein EV682_11573 [Iodobacter fluviatilis]|uniref:Uncharacterized protein n=1 Tax=Iodobacter fluviatilis TaxID=537 RepID=A0A377QAN9_9NEIS|nr:hypothetical protein EV682_11573 [Iodobacter fluviatilis]STQ91659.1 Uncharacterised protein [Iodobacter fluviatilis]
MTAVKLHGLISLAPGKTVIHYAINSGSVGETEAQMGDAPTLKKGRQEFQLKRRPNWAEPNEKLNDRTA